MTQANSFDPRLARLANARKQAIADKFGVAAHVANKLAAAVTVIELRDGFEANASIVTAVDLPSGTQCARVVSGGTVRAAEKMVVDRISALNAELDKKFGE